MIGCHFGRNFQVTVSGGSYQDGLSTTIQGVPPGMKITEQEIYRDLLLRKPGADELSSPRKEPDLPGDGDEHLDLVVAKAGLRGWIGFGFVGIVPTAKRLKRPAPSNNN